MRRIVTVGGIVVTAMLAGSIAAAAEPRAADYPSRGLPGAMQPRPRPPLPARRCPALLERPAPPAPPKTPGTSGTPGTPGTPGSPDTSGVPGTPEHPEALERPALLEHPAARERRHSWNTRRPGNARHTWNTQRPGIAWHSRSARHSRNAWRPRRSQCSRCCPWCSRRSRCCPWCSGRSRCSCRSWFSGPSRAHDACGRHGRVDRPGCGARRACPRDGALGIDTRGRRIGTRGLGGRGRDHGGIIRP